MARKARIVTINDKPYRFSKFEMELIESHGITAGMVSKRVKDGWELHEAMDAPEGTRLSEYREKKTITSKRTLCVLPDGKRHIRES